MQAIREDELTEIAPMLSHNTVQVYIYIKVRAFLNSNNTTLIL